MWYAVMRKRTRGIFIGSLVVRHSDHHASLLKDDWQEVPAEQIGVEGAEPTQPAQSSIDWEL